LACAAIFQHTTRIILLCSNRKTISMPNHLRIHSNPSSDILKYANSNSPDDPPSAQPTILHPYPMHPRLKALAPPTPSRPLGNAPPFICMSAQLVHHLTTGHRREPPKPPRQHVCEWPACTIWSCETPATDLSTRQKRRRRKHAKVVGRVGPYSKFNFLSDCVWFGPLAFPKRCDGHDSIAFQVKSNPSRGREQRR
jgi:hypothetical protein